MRILYGVQTTGNGHLSRASQLIPYLKQAGHQVDVIFSGGGCGKIWNLEVFKPYTIYQGLTFSTHKGRIDYLNTIKNINVRQFYRDIKSHQSSHYDLVLSDFEPISTRIAKHHNIKSLGISHQAAFQYNIPKAFNPMGALITNWFARTDYNLGVHWHHFDQPILPPIIEHELADRQIHIQKAKILVYMPQLNQQQLTALLRKFPDYRFHIYSQVDKPIQEKNIYWHPFSRENFSQDLLSCAGVMCQAGFELASEALHIGKKVLMYPIKGQYEQLSNALAIQKLGKGDVMHDFSKSILENWLQRKPIEAMHYPNVAKATADWLSAHGNTFTQNEINQLAVALWQDQDTYSLETQYA